MNRIVLRAHPAPEPHIVVFAGAGASIAVSPDYPTTDGFFKLLPDNITNDPLFSRLHKFLTEKRGLTTVDIEALLWALHEVRTACEEISDQNRAGGFLLAHAQQQLGGVSPPSITTPLGQLLPHLTILEDKINAQVYSCYGREPTDLDAVDTTWLPLLKALMSEFHIDVFTTNYDCVLEYVIRSASLQIETGHRGFFNRLELHAWSKEKANTTPLLTKLHGSVDWTWGPKKEIYVGNPSYRGSHAPHVIIYPGFKGTPTEEPFMTFHSYFADSIRNATAVVFIGYAFRDEYINQLLLAELPRSATLIAINPADELWQPRPSWATRMKHIAEPFGHEAIAQALDALGSKQSALEEAKTTA